MTLSQLVAHQTKGYARFHQNRRNLRIHLLTVPIFMAGNVLLLLALWPLSGWWAGLGLILMALALAAQGKGHGLEEHPTEPFTGVLNFVLRILLEQWLSFPRFVAAGAWRIAVTA